MYDVYGTLCGTYSEACEVAGIETPAQLAAEGMWIDSWAECIGQHPYGPQPGFDTVAPLRQPVICSCRPGDSGPDDYDDCPF